MSVMKKRILKLSALALVMALIWQLCTFLLTRNFVTSELHVRGFYREPKNTLDVAVIGCSELYADYSPPIAYDESGFTSYNLCYSGTPSTLYNSMLKEFCRRQQPQLVVFEVNGFFYNEKDSNTESALRNWLDNERHSADWARDINEFVEPEDRVNYYLTLLKYHDNWKRPEGQIERLECFYDGYLKSDLSLMKAFGTRTTNKSSIVTEKDKHLKLPEYGRKYLNKTLEYCKEQGFENVLFIRAPHKDPLIESTSRELDEIISGYGYDYADFDALSDEIGIDREADFYNSEHMNVFGNEKFTRYFSRYITEHYDISTDHSESTDSDWKTCADYTIDTFEILKKRTLENEDIPYHEYTDASEENHQKLIDREKHNRAKREAGEDAGLDV